MPRVETVEDYVNAFSGPGREMLERLRALANTAAPDSAEAIKWGAPAWLAPSGTILFMVSGHAKHANFVFTPSTRQAFDADLADVPTGKGSVKLPYTQPIPTELLHGMIAYRVREHEVDGVLWM